MTEAIDNVVYLKSLYQAFANGDVPTVLAAMDEDIEWNEAEGNPHNLDHPFVFARIANDIDGFEIRSERFIAQGDALVILGRYLGSEGARHWGAPRCASRACLGSRERQGRSLSAVRRHPEPGQRTGTRVSQKRPNREITMRVAIPS
jgi:hypothetical protein